MHITCAYVYVSEGVWFHNTYCGENDAWWFHGVLWWQYDPTMVTTSFVVTTCWSCYGEVPLKQILLAGERERERERERESVSHFRQLSNGCYLQRLCVIQWRGIFELNSLSH